MLLDLFLAFLQIGALSFGGGYASLPLLKDILVTQHGWLTVSEFTDIITISQMTPGPLAINAATFVGMRLGGFWGMILATLGSVLPGVIIASVFYLLWQRYGKMDWMQKILKVLQPATVGLIAAAAVSLCISAYFPDRVIDVWMIVLGIGALYLLARRNWNPILVMVLCGAAYTGIALLVQ